MRGIVAAEAAHIINALAPVDATGGKVAQRFSMACHGHASITVALGVSAAAPTAILVKACSDNAGTGATALPFAYYEETTSAGDTLSPRKNATAAGIAPTANDNVFYVIELDAMELPSDKPWVEVSITNGVNSVLASVHVLLSGSRYGGEASATALA